MLWRWFTSSASVRWRCYVRGHCCATLSDITIVALSSATAGIFTPLKLANVTYQGLVYCCVDWLDLRKWWRKSQQCRFNLLHCIVNSPPKWKKIFFRYLKTSIQLSKEVANNIDKQVGFQHSPCCLTFIFIVNVNENIMSELHSRNRCSALSKHTSCVSLHSSPNSRALKLSHLCSPLPDSYWEQGLSLSLYRILSSWGRHLIIVE